MPRRTISPPTRRIGSLPPSRTYPFPYDRGIVPRLQNRSLGRRPDTGFIPVGQSDEWYSGRLSLAADLFQYPDVNCRQTGFDLSVTLRREALSFVPSRSRMASPRSSSRPLADLPVGATARIAEIRGGRQLTRRLLSLGLRVGSEISVLHHRGRGVVLSTGDTRVALGGGVVEKLLVESEGAQAARAD